MQGSIGCIMMSDKSYVVLSIKAQIIAFFDNYDKLLLIGLRGIKYNE